MGRQLRRVRRVGCGAMAGLLTLGAADIAHTEITVPDRPHRAEFVGTVDCKKAEYVVVYVNPTGKPVAQWLEAHNRSIIESNGGASLVTWYGTSEDVAGFRDMVDEKLAECTTEERPDTVPTVFNSMSLGGKYTQWVLNAGLKHADVVAHVTEAGAVSPDAIIDAGGQVLVSIASTGQPVPIGKGGIFLSAAESERQRVGLMKVIDDAGTHKVIQDSMNETDPKVLAWQMVANSKPYPAPLRSTDNTTPTHYLWTRGDPVINTGLARWQLGLMTRAPITEYEVSVEGTDGHAHAAGWIGAARPAYDPVYRVVYEAIARQIKNKASDQSCLRQGMRSDRQACV